MRGSEVGRLRSLVNRYDSETVLSESGGAYSLPVGLFGISGDPDDPDACGAVVFLDDERSEIKRMWVAPEVRGKELATKLLACLENLSLQSGRTTIVLDTNRSLSEAITFYLRHGYIPIGRYNDNRHAHHWFEKTLAQKQNE